MTKKNRQVHTPNKLLYTLGYKFHYEKFVKKTLGAQIENSVLAGLKPPFIVLGNHVSKLDFGIVAATMYPYKCNFVGSVNSFIGKNRLLKQLGTLSKRQFTTDLQLVRNIKYLVGKKATVMLFPEARMSADGRSSPIPQGVAKLVKTAGATVLCVNLSGAYLTMPKWLGTRRNAAVKSNLSLIATPFELAELSTEEIHKKIVTALQYDDYKFQRENRVKIDADRCTNLHTLLYRCPLCKTEFSMRSEEKFLYCEKCNERYEMDEFGVIKNAKLPFDSVTAWYDLQRAEVKKSVADGSYFFEDECVVEAIFEKPEFVSLGSGKLTHNLDGFELILPDKTEVFPSAKNFAVAFDTGACIYLATSVASYKISPINKPFECTKIALAVEEIYNFINEKKVQN